MNTNNLSPAAQKLLTAMYLERFPNLLLDFNSFGDLWSLFPNLNKRSQMTAARERADSEEYRILDYFEHLNLLAAWEIPPMSDIVVKNHGLKAMERSIEEFKTAHELKAFAIEVLTEMGDETYLEPNLPLDDFLVRLIPKATRQVRTERFRDFIHFKVKEWRESPDLPSDPVASTSTLDVDEEAQVRMKYFECEGVSETIQTSLQQMFISWWKERVPSTRLAETNVAKKRGKGDKMGKMLELLLPTAKTTGGLTKKKWLDKAQLVLDISEKTCYRYFKELDGRYELRKNGRFYPLGDSSEK
jgi:hypothetical protein